MTQNAIVLAAAGHPMTGIIVAMAAETLEDLQRRSQEILARVEEIENLESIGDAEEAELSALADEAEKLQKRLDAKLKLSNLSAGQGRKTLPVPANHGGQGGGGRQAVPAVAKKIDPRGGFNSFGEFAVAVLNGSRQGVQPDNRLLNAASTYGSEGTGADGGYAVPSEYSREIWQKVMGEDSLANRCDQLVTGANSMTFPKDETTPWQSSGGVQAYWESEAPATTASKPALEMSTLRLGKLMALVPVSDELLEDAPGMESYLRAKAPSKMQAKLNTAIIRGTGAGQPRGILASGSLVSVAKETGQAAATINYTNITKMWSRMYAPCRRNAVWLINQDAEPQLNMMEFSKDSIVPIPVYLPANGVAGTPYSTLMGRPVLPMGACSTLGVQGDIILADLTQYMILTKGQQIRTDVSIHLYFDQGLQAFRFIFRVNGQPWWGNAITPENGSNTLSWAVTLDARA